MTIAIQSLAHLCGHTEQTSQAVSKALWDAITVVYVVEESVASLSHGVEEVSIVLRPKTKREDTGLSSDLT